MNTNSDNEELLRDMVQDAAPADFRAALLNRMLQEVQHQKRNRQWTRRLALLGCLVTAVGLWLSLFLTSKQPTKPAPGPPSHIVYSQPLDPASIVKTRVDGFDLIYSTVEAVALLRTYDHPKLFEAVGDAELLSLLAGHPAALVRHGPGQVELVFVNPADRVGFPVQ